MTKAQQTERAEAIDRLREWIKPGDTVYTICEHVSRSGMSREIRCVLLSCEDGKAVDLHPNHAIGLALGLRQGKRDGLIIGGCGTDMGFHLVYELSYTLYGSGYKCLGRGEDGRSRCPSNYHVNHHDHVRCPADCVRLRFAHPSATPITDQGWQGNTLPLSVALFQHWPKPLIVEGIEPYEHPYAYIAVQIDRETDPNSPDAYTWCERCQGTGSIPNPDGPERWDLIHTDGYALRQRWL